MGMNDTPSSERIHIGIFGRRNAGKSSLINALTGQNAAIVSDIKGTTTDPVSKTMEILPLGPVVIIDTPGIDDTGELGSQRVRAGYKALDRTDIALIVIDNAEMSDEDKELIGLVRQKNIPYIIVYNKCDINNFVPMEKNEIAVSAKENINISELRELIAGQCDSGDKKSRIIGDLLNKEDIAVLVIPIDEAAPKGRLILPQQQTIRDILDAGASALAVRDSEFSNTLNALGKKPAVVITDSQAFKQISAQTPEDIKLTSFSILMARHKGILAGAVRGVRAIEDLSDNDTVLISEGCTHKRQCGDIGTVKLPAWIKEYTGKNVKFEFTSGMGFPEGLSRYKMIVHCGGCMLNEREMLSRMSSAGGQDIPITNYGILIAYINGILKRSVEILPDISEILK